MVFRFALFFCIMLAYLAVAHRYVYVRLVRDPKPPERWRKIGKWLLVALPFATVSGFFAPGRMPPGTGKPWAIAALLWFGTLFVAVLVLLALDAIRLGWALHRLGRRWVGRPLPAPDPERRLFFSRALAGVAALGSGGISAASVDTALSAPTVRRLEVPIVGLPAELEGLCIAQVSDVHVGPTIGTAFVRRIVDTVNALSPDLVAITGDLVDGSVARLREAVAPLAQLRSRFGTFFVTGNHEYYSGADDWCAHLGTLGIRVLRNQRAEIAVGAGRLDLIGVEDFFATGPRHDLTTAMAGRETSRPAVLLAHQPRSIFQAAAAGIDLQLSGHTHGGQIWPFTYLVYLQQPYVRGLHLHASRTWIYVHPGTGYWGPPMRLGVPPEVALIRLVRGQRPNSSS